MPLEEFAWSKSGVPATAWPNLAGSAQPAVVSGVLLLLFACRGLNGFGGGNLAGAYQPLPQGVVTPVAKKRHRISHSAALEWYPVVPTSAQGLHDNRVTLEYLRKNSRGTSGDPKCPHSIPAIIAVAAQDLEGRRF